MRLLFFSHEFSKSFVDRLDPAYQTIKFAFPCFPFCLLAGWEEVRFSLFLVAPAADKRLYSSNIEVFLVASISVPKIMVRSANSIKRDELI